jgi:hypothetical protein
MNPEEITTEMAEKFLKTVTANPEVDYLTRRLLRKGGVGVSKWVKFCKGGGKIVPFIGWAWWFLGEAFFDISEAE